MTNERTNLQEPRDGWSDRILAARAAKQLAAAAYDQTIRDANKAAGREATQTVWGSSAST
ncbi:hypothetical protein ABZ599_15470 [Streptomyces misionensis]|uniref:hypothetical protein n=1 Tax=Streptomyces misionensis TaxID=67331 RepID=UPI0033E486D7